MSVPRLDPTTAVRVVSEYPLPVKHFLQALGAEPEYAVGERHGAVDRRRPPVDRAHFREVCVAVPFRQLTLVDPEAAQVGLGDAELAT